MIFFFGKALLVPLFFCLIPGAEVVGGGCAVEEYLLLICFPVRSKSNNEHVRITHGRMPRSVVSREF